MEHTMQALRPGERGTVLRIEAEKDWERRMREFGLTENASVECVGCSPLGDPAAYRIRGVIVALRGRDASRVYLRR